MNTNNSIINKSYGKSKDFKITEINHKFSDKLLKTQFQFDLFFSKLTNLVMIDGKKLKASKLLFNMLIILKKRIKKDFEKKTIEKLSVKSLSKAGFNFNKLEKQGQLNFTLLQVISKALENITPSLEIRKVRVAGSTYMVPAVLSKKKQETLALKWLLESVKKRQKNSKLDFSTCLADEILDASKKLGQTRQKRDELHRLAQLNRAYIRYRWW